MKVTKPLGLLFAIAFCVLSEVKAQTITISGKITSSNWTSFAVNDTFSYAVKLQNPYISNPVLGTYGYGASEASLSSNGNVYGFNTHIVQGFSTQNIPRGNVTGMDFDSRNSSSLITRIHFELYSFYPNSLSITDSQGMLLSVFPFSQIIAQGWNFITDSSGGQYSFAVTGCTFAKGIPVITWPTPAGIYYGTILNGNQLNATSNVAGSFSYSPLGGGLLSPGTHTLTTIFTPTNTDYNQVVTVERSLVVTYQSDSRIPAGFDIQSYYAHNGDVAAVYGADLFGAWVHYHDHGIYQGEVFDDLFRVEEYLTMYPELFAIFGTNLGAALDHWLSTGRIEGKLGRIPPEFSAAGYFARNTDVATAVNNDPILAWGHFWLYGIYEGRAYDDELRAFEYLAINADLTAAFVNDWRQAALHWMRYGRTEGRLGRLPLTFSVATYLSRNPDVAAVWGTDPTTVFLHFWLYGINEARTYDDLFRVDEYLALNPDLATLFGADRRGAFKHWVRYGQAEGRPGRNS